MSQDKQVTFRMEHLDRYAVIKEPCTIVVKNNSRLKMSDIYLEDNNPRWILSLKVITEFNLLLLKQLCKEGNQLTYSEMGHLLMRGAIWEEQVSSESDLPCKGEEMIAVFGYVNSILMCTSITLIPRRQPNLYLHASEVMDEINEFEKIINNMRDEK